jgi:NADH:ubiquinone oxidoreductase subunit H
MVCCESQEVSECTTNSTLPAHRTADIIMHKPIVCEFEKYTNFPFISFSPIWRLHPTNKSIQLLTSMWFTFFLCLCCIYTSTNKKISLLGEHREAAMVDTYKKKPMVLGDGEENGTVLFVWKKDLLLFCVRVDKLFKSK